MPSGTAEQDNWIRAVLGVDLAARRDVARLGASPPTIDEAAFDAAWQSARETWQDSIETVDRQIERLRSAMMVSGDAEFVLIADRGLTALTGNHKTPVVKAIVEIAGSAGEDRRQAASRAQSAISAFQAHIDTDPRVRVLDEEAQGVFGVRLGIRESIGRGLQALEQTLRPLVAG